MEKPNYLGIRFWIREVAGKVIVMGKQTNPRTLTANVFISMKILEAAVAGEPKHTRSQQMPKTPRNHLLVPHITLSNPPPPNFTL
jgi:hypothetical protein